MKGTKFSVSLASLVGFWILCLGVMSMEAKADEPLQAPQLVIQKTSEELQKTLQQIEYKKNFAKATEVVDGIIQAHVDFDKVSMLILGKYWKTATPAQQAKFKAEFRKLLVRTYTTAFTEYANWTIRYLPIKLDSSDKRVLVRTEILQSGAQPVGVDYRMANQSGDWKVYDVVIEGISLIQNYRTSFTNEISRTGSLDQLITELSQRNSSAMKERLGDSRPDSRNNAS